MQTVRKRKKKRIEWIDVFCYGFVILVVIVTLYPVLHLMALSLSSSKAVSKNAVSIWPIGLNFQAYKQVMATGTVPKSFVNSIIYTFIGTVINMLLTSTMAYALSKKRLPFYGFFTKFVLITMYVSGGLIPSFLLVNSLGLFDSMWALILPSAISTYTLIVLRSFFAAMPEELEESANLDGANDLIVFWKIVLPPVKSRTRNGCPVLPGRPLEFLLFRNDLPAGCG